MCHRCNIRWCLVHWDIYNASCLSTYWQRQIILFLCLDTTCYIKSSRIYSLGDKSLLSRGNFRTISVAAIEILTSPARLDGEINKQNAEPAPVYLIDHFWKCQIFDYWTVHLTRTQWTTRRLKNFSWQWFQDLIRYWIFQRCNQRGRNLY